MIRFLVRRVGFAIVVLWLVVTAVFVVYLAIPHDPARLVAGRQATPATLAAVRRTLWLDRPAVVRYAHFWDLLVHGNLISYRNNEPVTALLGAALPVDLSLLAGGAVLWLTIGVGIGTAAARRPRGMVDRSATVFVLTFLSFPAFALGLLLLYTLFYLPRVHGMAWFPPPGYVPLSAGLPSWAHALILPWITVALVTAAPYAQLTRASLREILGEDYIRTARAKGLSERRVVYLHGLRGAVAPIVTTLGIDLATLFSVLILTESVFGLNGVGRLVVTAFEAQDLPVIMGAVLLTALFTVTATTVVDVLYALLDPRVRIG